jgi:hypothetical protein
MFLNYNKQVLACIYIIYYCLCLQACGAPNQQAPNLGAEDIMLRATKRNRSFLFAPTTAESPSTVKDNSEPSNVESIKSAPTTKKELAAIDAYVTRLAKRLLIVMHEEQQKTTPIIHIVDKQEASITMALSGKLTISTELLRQLNDEAELATVLIRTILTLKYQQIYLTDTLATPQLISIDSDCLTYLSRAGFDPHALIDLEQIYINPKHPRYQAWIRAIFKTLPPDASAMMTIQQKLKTIPHKGLQRNSEQYQSICK